MLPEPQSIGFNKLDILLEKMSEFEHWSESEQHLLTDWRRRISTGCIKIQHHTEYRLLRQMLIKRTLRSFFMSKIVLKYDFLIWTWTKPMFQSNSPSVQLMERVTYQILARTYRLLRNEWIVVAHLKSLVHEKLKSEQMFRVHEQRKSMSMFAISIFLWSKIFVKRKRSILSSYVLEIRKGIEISHFDSTQTELFGGIS